jgi:hypothetical protein
VGKEFLNTGMGIFVVAFLLRDNSIMEHKRISPERRLWKNQILTSVQIIVTWQILSSQSDDLDDNLYTEAFLKTKRKI